MKICSKCRVEKMESEFSRYRRRRSGFRSECLECARKAYWALTPEERSRRAFKNKCSRYGISTEDFEKMLREQAGKCRICKRDERLHIDHCHSTGGVRGLLCFNCNAALGLLKEDPELFLAARDYLRR